MIVIDKAGRKCFYSSLADYNEFGASANDNALALIGAGLIDKLTEELEKEYPDGVDKDSLEDIFMDKLYLAASVGCNSFDEVQIKMIDEQTDTTDYTISELYHLLDNRQINLTITEEETKKVIYKDTLEEVSEAMIEKVIIHVKLVSDGELEVTVQGEEK